MPRIIIDEDRCKGCSLCAYSCPKKIIKLAKEKINLKGYHPAELLNDDKCTGCATCAKMCPDVAIRVER